MFKILLIVLFLQIFDISIASEVKQLNSKINFLPDLKYMLKEQSDENLLKFLYLLNKLEVNGNEFVSDELFTIIVPKFTFDIRNIDNDTLQKFIFEHIIPGIRIQVLKNGEIYNNMNKNSIKVKSLSPNKWRINDINVHEFNSHSTKLISFIKIDGYLDGIKSNFTKRNVQDHNSYNEQEKLIKKDVNKSDLLDEKTNKNKYGVLQNYLSTIKSGTKVFQHFLKTSNLSTIFEDATDNFIILVPNDMAFQRWHPIDWGFFPFSVPEFTEDIMRNHIILLKQQPFSPNSVEKEVKLKALGGEFVTFKVQPIPSINNVSILSNITLSNGNVVYIISEVLFMNDEKVSKLHQMNKDKETPPLLAFPWLISQFLSHSFLALEKDNRFTQIVRFLSLADIASLIPGSNYTFFVPFDDSFEKYGFDELADDVLKSNKSTNFILNHFVKGRLYNRDLRDGEIYETVGGRRIRIRKETSVNIFINQAKIVESEVFVYNLGTMFYIDDVLNPEILQNVYKNTQNQERENIESFEENFTTETSDVNEIYKKLNNAEPLIDKDQSFLQTMHDTYADVEFISSDNIEDFSSSDSYITSQALPSSELISPPPK
ncbi:hypothetical protein PVAND_014376 [Polypedilum vanderplanki]|uniref:FAS1 domain-containing protein n=1 Tax=Polypedilum vanderplanki TaxID=319348 RepID=A0A9J6B9H1_POLVA|nr:hypothetical protein PVAND_014376 [Polypedilum vanderplanki]